jgi:MSHA biogenesis protein MshM
MYLEYYSLDRPPFRITPDPSLFYTGGENGRGVVLEALLYAVTSGEGILKVVGEVGSGKTMLCRMLEQRLPDSVEVVYLANPNLSPHDILYAIAFELKLPVDHSTQRLVLMQHLQEYLLKQHSENRTVLVIIEEAQSMPIETLEEVRLFSNLETHQHKLMQIVLFGQPELDKNLQDKSIRQLRERITHSFDLRPLSADEVSDYIRFRLQAAGCPAPQVFSNAAEKLIAKASGGLTRRINILADKAMLSAYAESATGQRPRTIDNLLQPAVQTSHVRAAMKDSGYKPQILTLPRLGILGAVLLALMLGITWWLWGGEEDALAAQAVQETAVPASVVAPAAASAPIAAIVEQAQPSVPAEEAEAVVAENVERTLSPTLGQSPVKDEPANTSSVLRQPMQAIGTLNPLLRTRSIAMQDWLVETDPDAHTVQLLSVSSTDSAYVARILNRLDQAGLIDKSYTCISNSQGQDYWKVVYGDFATVEQARNIIYGLPSSVRNNGPYVQSVRRMDCNVAMDLN